MVRLQPSPTHLYLHPKPYLFQYHNGSIATSSHAFPNLPEFAPFNTIMVRLQLVGWLEPHPRQDETSFNTIMVRLQLESSQQGLG